MNSATSFQPYTIRWWFVRHAPVINPDDVAYGSMDLDCNFETMDAQIEFLRAQLPRVETAQTSALVRSQQTLDAVWPDHAFRAEACWNEQSLGAWEGQPRKEVYRHDGPIRSLFADPMGYRPPDTSDGRKGENWADLIGRVSRGIASAEHIERSRDEVVFCHAGTIRAMTGLTLDLVPERAFGFQVEHMSLSRFDSVHFFDQGEVQQSWRIGGINLGPPGRAL